MFGRMEMWQTLEGWKFGSTFKVWVKTKPPFLPDFHVFFHVLEVGKKEIAWQFCEGDLFGMVSSRAPNSKLT